jgi:hypothetical protein
MGRVSCKKGEAFGPLSGPGMNSLFSASRAGEMVELRRKQKFSVGCEAINDRSALPQNLFTCTGGNDD